MSETIRSFQDLIAWQKARVLTANIYKATSQGSFARDFGLKDQIRRAAVSVMSNIACAELRSQLFVALDAGHLKESDFEGLMDAAVEVGRIVGGLRAGVQRKRSQSSVLSPQY